MLLRNLRQPANNPNQPGRVRHSNTASSVSQTLRSRSPEDKAERDDFLVSQERGSGSLDPDCCGPSVCARATESLGTFDFGLVYDEVVRVGPQNFERRCQCVGETWGEKGGGVEHAEM